MLNFNNYHILYLQALFKNVKKRKRSLESCDLVELIVGIKYIYDFCKLSFIYLLL